MCFPVNWAPFPALPARSFASTPAETAGAANKFPPNSSLQCGGVTGSDVRMVWRSGMNQHLFFVCLLFRSSCCFFMVLSALIMIKKESGECFRLRLGFSSLRIWKTGNGANGLRGTVYTPTL